MQNAKTIKKTARAAGIMFLIMVMIGPYSMMYVPSQLIMHGDATATAGNLMSSEPLFLSGIIGHLIILLADLSVAVLLYAILRPVNRTIALFAMVLRLIMVAMRGINLINYFIVLQLLNGTAGFTAAFETNQLHALVMVFLQAFDNGIDLDMVFFSFHLLLLGYLVFHSGFFPKIFGILLIIGFVGYLSTAASNLFFPRYELILTRIFMIPNAVSEVALMFWLLIKGLYVEKWEMRAREAAKTLN